jgi:hypothetical protein
MFQWAEGDETGRKCDQFQFIQALKCCANLKAVGWAATVASNADKTLVEEMHLQAFYKNKVWSLLSFTITLYFKVLLK